MATSRKVSSSEDIIVKIETDSSDAFSEDSAVDEEIQQQDTIIVHVLNFWGFFNSHSAVVLEESGSKKKEEKWYYKIDITSQPYLSPHINDPKCLSVLNKASEMKTLKIKANIHGIIAAWRKKYWEASNNCLTNNCADASAWFLENYANIAKPKACDLPIRCNYLSVGIFLPSFFFRNCVTLPGDIIESVKEVVKESGESENSKLLRKKYRK